MFKIDKLTNIYLVTTLGLLSYTLYDTYTKSDNYFSMWLNYLDNSMTNFIFYNFIISISIIIYKFNIFAFFSQVKQNQTFKILQKLRNKIVDFLIFLYIMGGNFTFQVFACIVFIFLLFICHYQAIFRSEYLIHTPTALSLNLNYRLLANILILAFFDFELIKYNIDLLYADQPAKVMFIYYIINISLSLIEPMVLFFADFYEKYTFTHIHNGDQFLAQISIYINVPKLFVQIALSIWISVKFGLMFWMIFIIIQHVIQINGIIKSHNRIKKLTDTMKNLKRVSEQELKQYHDQTCMVCFQDIKEAVLLPCKHIFHDQCLRQWIIKNANHFCPKCKKQFNFQKKKDEISQLLNIPHMPFGRRLNANNLGQLGDPNNLNNINQNLNNGRPNFKNFQNQFNPNGQNLNNPRIPDKNHIQHRSQHSLGQQKIMNKQFSNQRLRQKYNYEDHDYSYQNRREVQNMIVNPMHLLSLDTPLQVLDLKKKLLVRIGSLPFGMPTQAVSYRTVRHMRIRERYQLANEELVRNLSCTPQEQMLLLADN